MSGRRFWLTGCAAAAASLVAAPVHSGDGPAPSAQAWFNNHPDIRFAPESAYGPFVFARPDGTVAGLSVDLLAALATRVGMRFRMLAAQPLSKILDDLQARRADLVSSLRPTPQRSAFLGFTRPYVEVPVVLAVRRQQPALLKALAGRPVGVGSGYAVEGFVRQRHPGVGWVPFADDSAALRALAAGAIDAAVLDVASLAHETQQLGIDSIVVAEGVEFRYPLSFAVRDDWPELVTILDQGLAGLSSRERDQIIQRWLGRYTSMLSAPLSDSVVWGAGLLAAGVGMAAWTALARRRSGAAGDGHGRATEAS